MRSFIRRKRLGQHFLNNKRLAKKIVHFAGVEDTVVLEIGSGKGILTRHIAEKAKKVFAVEIDKNLVNILKTLNLLNIVIINENFLKLNLKDFGRPVIVGNIPYSITTPILQTLVKQRNHFKRAVLTIQKEYGERILAKAGSRQFGSISLYLNYYFLIKKGFVISAKYFSPKPKVSSVVISLQKKKLPFILKNEDKFFQFIKGVFCYRRKSLKNAIINYLHKSPKGIKPDLLQKRPENLSLYDFRYVFKQLKLG